ncbi:hypothetical protein K9U39_06785 [Rhodoblastus acidophilus]|uniref:Uncharacterized protein n=1 Tax=Candidatus Rhodoblastus alkanivorans TaxID=2954117 RepID=A0ABS9Z6T8_9HYPH|nr:hypothetical protein [Candidatus Rhodoblastus alkanivorans]MCI4680241.1 hypothetical protein [Candidatus Rhodoblastus alkanivorans]MCI4683344.1 hypothetical protein [Candidatus Rhodoblastus alkanivorans]MDI4640657.1 hypothetical protein [Rhodoblastus acidophilus]
MFRNELGERRWPVLIVALGLTIAPLLAILVNKSLAPWVFLPFKWRNLLFLVFVPFVLGVVSETRPIMVGDLEARDGSVVFAAIVLIVWFVLLLKGWGFDLWANVLPLGVFVSQVGAFHAGRWAGRIPRHRLPDDPGHG